MVYRSGVSTLTRIYRVRKPLPLKGYPLSTRTNLRPQIVIPSAYASPVNTGSMASSIISAVTILQSLSKISYSVAWTGTAPVGTISVQLSDDYEFENGVVISSGTWNTASLNYNGTVVTSIPITGNSGNGLIDLLETATYACRLVYTASSGTGTISATVTGKVS